MLKPTNPSKFYVFLPFGILALLVFYKSYLAPFTHDEAFSYLTFSSKNIKDILSYKVDTSANNHLINTLFMKFMGSIGLQHPFFLRLLSSISFLLFVYSLMQISKTDKSYYPSLLAIMVCSSPYLLDFFAMARGYGFSFSMMVFSIYLLLKHEQSNNLFWSIQVATIAMLSNFNLVYFWAALGIIHITTLVQTNKNTRSFIKSGIIHYIFPLLAISYLYIVFNRLKEAQQLYFGGSAGIIENLVNDQLWCLIYDKNYEYNSLYLQIWQFLPIALSLFAIVLLTIKNLRSNKAVLNWIKVHGILIVSFVLIELNHRLTGSLYPLKRTGLFMSLLLGLSLLLFFRLLIHYKLLKIPTLLVGFGISSLLFYHTINSYQSARFREIPYDSHQHEILKTLDSIATDKNQVLNISANWQLGPSLNFYKKTQNLIWLPETKRDPIRPNVKYLLVFEEEMNILPKDSFGIVLYYPEDNLYLLSR